MNAVFTPSDASRAAGHGYRSRLKLRVSDRDAAVSVRSATAQLEASREWGLIPAKKSLRHGGKDPPADAHRAREQGRRRDANQRVYLGSAHPGRPFGHVSGCKSRGAVAVR